MRQQGERLERVLERRLAWKIWKEVSHEGRTASFVCGTCQTEQQSSLVDSRRRRKALQKLKATGGVGFLIRPQITGRSRHARAPRTEGPAASWNQTRRLPRERRRKGAVWARKTQLVADLCLMLAVRQQPPLQSPPPLFFSFSFTEA